MNRRLQLGLFLVGSALFGYLLSRLGFTHLLKNLQDTGWTIVPVLLLYLLALLCWGEAWRLTLREEAHRPGFWRSFAITASSFAINYVTPVMGVGGEGFRAGALAAWTGKQRAAGSIVTYYMLHSLSNLLGWVIAIGLALAFYVRDPALFTAFALAGMVMLLLVLFVFSRHREGVFAMVLAVLHRLPLMGSAAATLEARRETLMELDDQIAGFYHRAPRRFLAALGLDLLGRSLVYGEYLLIARSVGLAVGYAPAFIMGSLGTLGINLLFFLPLEMGSKEGGMYLIFRVLGLSPSLGVYAALVSRLRELIWAAIGLLLMWLATRGREHPSGVRSPELASPVPPSPVA